MSSKAKVLLAVVILALIGAGVYIFLKKKQVPEPAAPVVEAPQEISPVYKVIGSSVEGRKIESYTYGKGERHIVFVGGIHGGYEWNSVLLAYQMKDYLDANPTSVPSNVKVTIIPSANPDAVFDVVGVEGRFTVANVTKDQAVLEASRFNANSVDLNRNFDCKWKPTGTWRSKTVSAGTAAFSEPEAQAIKDYMVKNTPDAVVFWHSQANTVYASECTAGVLPVTLDIMTTYSKAAGYNAVKSFDAYPVTGDAEGWLASINIPAITVELKTHESVEWEQNLAGVKALLTYFEQKK